MYHSHVTMLEDAFTKTEVDNTSAISVEDSQFWKIIQSKAVKYVSSLWEMPLIFKLERQRLPNNKAVGLKRLIKVAQRMHSSPKLAQQHHEFLQNLFDNRHAEHPPPLRDNQEVFYFAFL